MYSLQYTGQFKKDLKKLKKRSQKNFKTLEHFVGELVNTGFSGTPAKYKPHTLKGNFKDCYECHVMNDLLLIWKEDISNKIITLIRTGTHSDLF